MGDFEYVANAEMNRFWDVGGFENEYKAPTLKVQPNTGFYEPQEKEGSPF